jgi:hypothetical protein
VARWLTMTPSLSELDFLYRQISEHQAEIDALLRRARELESYDDEGEARRDAAFEKAKIDREERP